MSRIGRQPVTWKASTKLSLAGRTVKVEGGKFTLTQELHPALDLAVDEGARSAKLTRRGETGAERAVHGLFRALLANMVEGVEKGFEKRLDIQGVGFNAKIEGPSLVLNIGFNKPVKRIIPKGLLCEVPQPTLVVIKGADKQLVGQFAAEIRSLRKPEPYKGKGIRYDGEYVRRKVGKSLGT